jgi:hypothetical protein
MQEKKGKAKEHSLFFLSLTLVFALPQAWLSGGEGAASRPATGAEVGVGKSLAVRQAIVTLQRVWRGHVARSQVHVMLQELMLEFGGADMELAVQAEAAIRIQALSRGVKVRTALHRGDDLEEGGEDVDEDENEDESEGGSAVLDGPKSQVRTLMLPVVPGEEESGEEAEFGDAQGRQGATLEDGAEGGIPGGGGGDLGIAIGEEEQGVADDEELQDDFITVPEPPLPGSVRGIDEMDARAAAVSVLEAMVAISSSALRRASTTRSSRKSSRPGTGSKESSRAASRQSGPVKAPTPSSASAFHEVDPQKPAHQARRTCVCVSPCLFTPSMRRDGLIRCFRLPHAHPSPLVLF